MSLEEAASTAINQCMNLQSDERCLIVTDDDRLSIGQALYTAGKEISENTILLQYPPGDQHGNEPPKPVDLAMQNVDVVLAPTTKSLSHTRARDKANEAGARVATLPGITETVFETGLNTDYESIKNQCDLLYEKLKTASEVRVTSPQGTDITFTVGKREWMRDTGIVHNAGEMSNLPAGEVFISPESASGNYVVDGTMMPHGKLDGEYLKFEVEDGHVTAISDDEIREQVEAAADEVGDAAYNIAELGIGTNIAVTDLVGSVLLDEKAAGTVHIAIGDDASIGGDIEAPIHLDGILRQPSVFVDGEAIELPTPN
ncbi:MAG: aminopeptidase [Halobacteriaceae archaeon]